MLCVKIQLEVIDLLIIAFTKNGDTNTSEVGGQVDVEVTRSIPAHQNDPDYE